MIKLLQTSRPLCRLVHARPGHWFNVLQVQGIYSHSIPYVRMYVSIEYLYACTVRLWLLVNYYCYWFVVHILCTYSYFQLSSVHITRMCMSGVSVSNDLMNMLTIFCLAILLYDNIIDWLYYAGLLAIFCWRYFFRTPCLL